MQEKHTEAPERTSYGECAAALFVQGYNCAQSLTGAFYKHTGLTREQMLRLCSSFGGGMGRLREVCGAVTGMFMISGLLQGYSEPQDTEGKAAQYARVQELARRFRERHGSIICRELLGVTGSEAPVPSERTARYYQERPCCALISSAADILAAYLYENGINLSSGTCSK